MNDADSKFVEASFKRYYFEHFDLIDIPNRILEREFGYQKLDSGMIRHLAIKNSKELHLLLMQNIPSDLYCSNAYYTFPNLPMKEKDWKEADLIFDIDAKDLNLSCRKDHTVSICSNCNAILDTDKCTKCSTAKIETKSLPCKYCIDASKIEVERLLEILTQDLGIDKENIKVYFSGNEGFHVYVYNSQFQLLGSKERADLSDYVMFKGMIPETLGMKQFKPNKTSFADLTESGWRGRFAKEYFGSKSNRSKVITQLLKDPTKQYHTFRDSIQTVSQKIGTKIDPNVTMDIHRIFRLGGSINSKSGLTKISCSDLAKFNPFSDAVFLSDDSVDMVANCPVPIRLKGRKFGPYHNDKVSVPTFVGVYMICKKLATTA